MNFKLNTDRSVAVDQDYFWKRIDKDTPRGVKLQLLTQGGIAVHGHWDGQTSFYTHWTPLPKLGT